MRSPSALLVDDDAISRRIVAAKLKSLASIVEAEDGQAAIEHLHVASVDLIIVDLDMPKISGLELIKYVRSHQSLRHIPIIVLTANELAGGLANSFMAGVTSALSKPLDWAAFGEHVRHVLELAHRSSHMALHDHLTGLPNRMLLSERLAQARTQASPESPVALHLIDLDRFKQVNDTLGHAAGDALLQQVATRLREVVKATDVIARLGGDEFAVLQSAGANAADALALAGRVIAALNAPFELAGARASIGASVGIDLITCPVQPAEQAMSNADTALYEAKRMGRGQALLFQSRTSGKSAHVSRLRRELQQALSSGHLAFRFIPELSCASSIPLALEAVLEWKEMGAEGPALLAAGGCGGLGSDLAPFILDEACDVAAQWNSQVPLTVAIDPTRLSGKALAGMVQDALMSSGLEPSRLEIAIAEQHLGDVLRLAGNPLQELHRMGVHLVLDHFGMGSITLRDFAAVPFSKLKVHAPFVDADGNALPQLTMLRMAMAMRFALGCEVVVVTTDAAAQGGAEGSVAGARSQHRAPGCSLSEADVEKLLVGPAAA